MSQEDHLERQKQQESNVLSMQNMQVNLTQNQYPYRDRGRSNNRAGRFQYTNQRGRGRYNNEVGNKQCQVWQIWPHCTQLLSHL